jgi:hypothetical protein
MQDAQSMAFVPPRGLPKTRDAPVVAAIVSLPPQRGHWITLSGLGARLMRWRTFSAWPGSVGVTMRSAGFGTAGS